MVSAVTASFNTEERLDELEAFYETNYFNLGTAQRAMEAAIESTEVNVDWMEMYEEIIDTWLRDVNDAIASLDSGAEGSGGRSGLGFALTLATTALAASYLI